MKRLVIITLALLVFAAAACGCGSGGGGSAPATPPTDSTAPTLTAVKPLNGATVPEAEFRSLSYVMSFSYSDVSPINESSISVKFQMDNGDIKDISSYFAAGSVSNSDGKYNYTIVSSGLGAFNRGLYNLNSNIEVDPVMRTTLKIKDSNGNTGEMTSQFTVKIDRPQ